MVSEFPDQSVFYDALQVGAFRALLFRCRIGDEVAFYAPLALLERERCHRRDLSIL
jgi:hypothetical protein